MLTQILPENPARIEELARAEVENLSLEEQEEWKQTLKSAAEVKQQSGPAILTIWDTRNHEPSRVTRNMLNIKLKAKRADGSFVFTAIDPKIKPKRGKFKCLLHADDPNRSHYDEIGLPVCPKSNLTSQFQVELHMKHRHKNEWATIERERQQKEKEEERAFQRSVINMTRTTNNAPADKPLSTETMEAPLYVKEAKTKK